MGLKVTMAVAFVTIVFAPPAWAVSLEKLHQEWCRRHLLGV